MHDGPHATPGLNMRVARTQADAVAMGVLAHARLAARMVSFRKALLEVAMSESRVHATCSPVLKWPRRLSVIAVEDDPAQMVRLPRRRAAPSVPTRQTLPHPPSPPPPAPLQKPLVAMLRVLGVMHVHKFSNAEEASRRPAPAP